MAVVQTNSNALANLYGSLPGTANASYIDTQYAEPLRSVAAVATTDSINSQYRMCRVWSGGCPGSITIVSDALGGSAAAKLGLYNAGTTTPANGTAGNAAIVVASQSLVSAIGPTNVRFSVQTASSMTKRWWEILGLASDPQVYYDLCWTLTAVAASNGNLALQYDEYR